MKTYRIPGTVCLAMLTLGGPALEAGGFDFKDWSSSFSAGVETYSNTSNAGTITGTSTCPACFGPNPGTWGVPTAITSKQFTSEFNTNGQQPGSTVDFFFSNNYAWGTGGQMLIGNIHNEFEYTLSAWDFLGNAINVNTWTPLGEFASSAPGTLGYFSTSSTQTSASGNSENFYVSDPMADPNSGQGGVVWIGGLQNVGRMRLVLTSSNLAPNAQSGDFMLFNVGTPTPEPAACLLTGLGLSGLAFLRRRKH